MKINKTFEIVMRTDEAQKCLDMFRDKVIPQPAIDAGFVFLSATCSVSDGDARYTVEVTKDV